MMEHKYKRLIKDTLIFSLGSLGSKLILFLMVPIYTNVLSKEEYGVTELIYTFMSLILPFVSVVIFDAVTRFGLAKEEKHENVLAVGLLVALAGGLLTVAITPIVGMYETISEWKWYLCAYIILNMLLSIEQNYMKVVNKNLLFAIVSIFQTLSLAVLNVVFLYFKDMGVQGYMLATIGSYVVAVSIPLIFGGIIPALRRARVEPRLLKAMVLFSAPLILNNVSWWLIQSSSKLMVEIMMSTAALGVYTVATKIPSLINVITSIFQQAWGISAIKEIESSNDTVFYANIFNILQTGVIGATMCILLVLNPFMSIYVASGYLGATQYVPLLLVSAVFSTISSYWGTMYSALKKSSNNMFTTLISAIVNIVLNYIFIRMLGLWGAVIGTIGSYAVIAFIRTVDVRRYIKININRTKLLINISLMMIQALLVSFNIYPYIASVLTIIVFIAINIGEIIKILKKIMRKVK